MTWRTYVVILFMLVADTAFGQTSVTDWTSFTSSTATGSLDGRSIAGSVAAGGPFTDIATGHFASPAWDAPALALPSSAEAIKLHPINGGASHTFAFSSPITSVRLYVENFDSNSAADITVDGAVSLSLLTASPSITFAPTSASSGQLATSNSSFNGEGDFVLELKGAINSVRLDYSAGQQDNEIDYTFVTVPEPTAIGAAFSLVALTALRRARRAL